MNPVVAILAILAITAAAFGAISHLATAISDELDAMVSTFRVEVPAEVLERIWHQQ